MNLWDNDGLPSPLHEHGNVLKGVGLPEMRGEKRRNLRTFPVLNQAVELIMFKLATLCRIMETAVTTTAPPRVCFPSFTYSAGPVRRPNARSAVLPWGALRSEGIRLRHSIGRHFASRLPASVTCPSSGRPDRPSLLSSPLTNSMVWVRERTIPTERPPLVGEVIANLCG
jgi:hypothetical protein